MRVMAHYVAWLVGLAAPETQTTDAERECLTRWAKGRRRVVEIGVWHGVTTCRLRSVMAPQGVLSAIDPFPPGRLGFSAQRRIAHREVNRIHNGTVRWIESDRAAAAAGHEPIDFLFIDGDHTEAGLLADWRAWSGLLVSGGIVPLHDSRSTPDRMIDDAGSVRITNEVILRDGRFETKEVVDSLTVLSRSG